MSELTTDYEKKYKTVLEDINKLATTPNLIRQVAINTLQSAMKQQLNYTAKTIINNGIHSLENIQDKSIESNFKVIHSQMCILAVSLLESLLKEYFANACSKISNINLENKKLTEIKVTALDLIVHDLKYTRDFGQLILDKEKGSFQDLKSIKRAFSDYFSKGLELKEESEKKIAFYLECRHVLVHRGGKVDKKFLDSVGTFNANVHDYKLNQMVELDNKDWEDMQQVFTELIVEATKRKN